MEIEKIVKLIELLNDKKGETESAFKVGEKYLFRTVTFIVTGEIIKINGAFVTLKDAAWIADTGRFNECINNGTFSEVEPVFVNPIVNTESLIDAYPWQHALPRDVK